MSDVIIVREPQTPQEFEAYFLTRYLVLRAPWGQPPGSEKDNQEEESIHAMAINSKGEVLGVCRMQVTEEGCVQLRFMGVTEQARGLGIGKQLMDYMETRAKKDNKHTILLHARENAVKFYESCGYRIIEKSHLLWGVIQHYLMEKKL